MRRGPKLSCSLLVHLWMRTGVMPSHCLFMRTWRDVVDVRMGPSRREREREWIPFDVQPQFHSPSTFDGSARRMVGRMANDLVFHRPLSSLIRVDIVI